MLKRASDYLAGLFILAALLSPNSVLADDTELLSQIGEAVRTLNYQGVMVYARDGEMHSLRIVHRYHEGREQERLQALTGEAREVIRDDEVVTCILPEQKKVLMDRHDLRGPLSTAAALTSEALSPHYSLQQEAPQRLVDRNCKVLSFLPLDEYRYGYRIWVDEETHLPLRIDLLGTAGNTLEQVMFTQVSFPEAIEDSALKPAVDPAGYSWVRQDSQSSMPVTTERSGWQVESLPPGFQLVSHDLHQDQSSIPPTETFLFSDGLATVSATIKPSGVKPSRLLGLSQIGAVHAFGRHANDSHVTVMGEVPAETVRFIAEHLKPLPLTASEQPAR